MNNFTLAAGMTLESFRVDVACIITTVRAARCRDGTMHKHIVRHLTVPFPSPDAPPPLATLEGERKRKAILGSRRAALFFFQKCGMQ